LRFSSGFWVQNIFGTFEKWAPGEKPAQILHEVELFCILLFACKADWNGYREIPQKNITNMTTVKLK